MVARHGKWTEFHGSMGVDFDPALASHVHWRFCGGLCAVGFVSPRLSAACYGGDVFHELDHRMHLASHMGRDSEMDH